MVEGKWQGVGWRQNSEGGVVFVGIRSLKEASQFLHLISIYSCFCFVRKSPVRFVRVTQGGKLITFLLCDRVTLVATRYDCYAVLLGGIFCPRWDPAGYRRPISLQHSAACTLAGRRVDSLFELNELM